MNLMTLLVASTLASTPAGMVKVDVAYFPEEVIIAEEAVPYRNGSVFRYFGFAVYAAVLYLPDEAPESPQVVGRYPKRLAIHYLRDIPKDVFVESANAILRKNSEVDMELLYPRLQIIYDAFEDVKKGDRYELVYTPDHDTILLFNGREICRVGGEDFARAFFGIWLSDTPISASLRDRLLRKDD